MGLSPPHRRHHHHGDRLFSPAAASGDNLDADQPRKTRANEPSDPVLCLAAPAGWLIRLAAFLAEHFASAILSLVFPFAVLVGESRSAPAAAASLIRRAAFGLLAAACTFAVLVAAFVVSVLLGVCLIRLCIEEPVTVRRPLHFDYTEAQPSAAASLGGARASALPAGHSVQVSLALVLPDSDHNRELGVFQITAEAISYTGSTMASSTHPCMLRYRSPPVRLVQAAVQTMPLAMGIRAETQAVTLEVLRYKESCDRRRRTELVRVVLQPRAGTTPLPQVYKAEFAVQTELPLAKKLLHRWKWTMCVWVSSSIYVVLLVLAVCWVQPGAPFVRDRGRSMSLADVRKPCALSRRDPSESSKREREVSGELLSGGGVMKWRERRSKRKARLLVAHGGTVALEFGECSASSSACEVIDDPGECAWSESSVSEVN